MIVTTSRIEDVDGLREQIPNIVPIDADLSLVQSHGVVCEVELHSGPSKVAHPDDLAGLAARVQAEDRLRRLVEPRRAAQSERHDKLGAVTRQTPLGRPSPRYSRCRRTRSTSRRLARRRHGSRRRGRGIGRGHVPLARSLRSSADTGARGVGRPSGLIGSQVAFATPASAPARSRRRDHVPPGVQP